jgi:hypothetical protein
MDDILNFAETSLRRDPNSKIKWLYDFIPANFSHVIEDLTIIERKPLAEKIRGRYKRVRVAWKGI